MQNVPFLWSATIPLRLKRQKRGNKMEHLFTNLSPEVIGLLVIGIVGVVMVGFMVYYICFAIIRITGAICSAFKIIESSRSEESGEALPPVGHLGFTMPDGGAPLRVGGEKEPCVKQQLQASTCDCRNGKMRCLTDSKCVRVGGDCQGIDLDNFTYSLCLGNAPASCPYSTLIADSHYCKCPIGNVLVKNFYKDVDDRLPRIPPTGVSRTVQTRH